MEFEDQELATWLEDTVRKIMEGKADGVAFVAQLQNGTICTSYFRAGPRGDGGGLCFGTGNNTPHRNV